MELKQLYYLSVCAETKSFSKAANVLYTAQSNVSKVIRSLEEELGFELFERLQYGIALTPAGRQVYEQAQVTLSSARQIMEYARTGQRQELRICMNPSHCLEDAFIEYYQEFQREDVHYSVMTAPTGQLIERLARGVDQIGFVYILESQLPLLQSRLEKEHLFCTMLTKTQARLYRGAKSDPERIDQIALVQDFEDEFSLRSVRGDREDRKGELPLHRVAVTTNSESLQKALLNRTDLGHIAAGELDGMKESEMDGLRSGNVYAEQPVLFGYVTRNDRNPDPLALHFISYIRKKLQKQSQDQNRRDK